MKNKHGLLCFLHIFLIKRTGYPVSKQTVKKILVYSVFVVEVFSCSDTFMQDCCFDRIRQSGSGD